MNNEQQMAGQVDDAAVLAAVGELRARVRRGNRRWRFLVLLEALGLAVAAPLAYLWLVFLLDGLVYLPTTGRALASLLFFAGVAWLAARLVVLWRRANFTEDEVALAMERHSPEPLQNRLINAMQLSREPGGQDAAARLAVVRENLDRLRRLRLEQAAHARPALVRIGIAVAILLAGLVFRAAVPERFDNAASRIFRPFAAVAPLYRTVLEVIPGDIEARPGTDVPVTVRISGRIPASLAVIRHAGGERSTEEVPVPAGTNEVVYVFRQVGRSVTYAVRGGDFVSPYYTISVPLPAELRQLRAVYRFPPYTRLPPREIEGPGGDLEAVWGTRVQMTFTLSDPAAEAALAIYPAADGNGEPAMETLALKRESDAVFSGEWTFDRTVAYRLRTRQEGRAAEDGARYVIRVIEDRPPDLQLAGVDPGGESAPDAVLPAAVTGRDDFGLVEAGLFYRVLPADPKAPPPEWTAVRTWPLADEPTLFTTNLPFALALMNAAEGDRVELAARGRDNDPRKGAAWHTGETAPLWLGGPGAALQRLYERILRAEAGLRALIEAQESRVTASTGWFRKLEPGSGLRWDDANNLRELAAAMKTEAEAQAGLRGQTAELARAMPEEAGTLRLALGMLADTEMVRAVRIFESVENRPAPPDKRAAIADARLTQERMLRSMREMADQYERFRRDWELQHMTPFTRMLAERQERMARESGTYGDMGADAADERLYAGTGRRQQKLHELAGLAQRAFREMSGRADEIGFTLAGAFEAAAAGFESRGVRTAMTEAETALLSGRWAGAAERQAAAAAGLGAIYAELVRVQAEAAQLAMETLRELAGLGPDAQKAIAALRPGSLEKLVEMDPSQLTLDEIINLQKMAEEMKKRFELNQNDKEFPDYAWNDAMAGLLKARKPPDNPDFSIMTLAERPGGQKTFPDSSDREGNKILAQLVAEHYEDIVGDLLEEADDLREDYETYNMQMGGQGIEEGNVGKQAGDISSVSGAAATGNQKPPTHDFAGASRIGRQGARAHGMVVGDESIDRRGRDEAQEGQQESPDQAGTLKETKSDDPQNDSSTGVGGKEVDSDEIPHFSLKDAGEWKDEYVDRLKPPRETARVVEHRGKPLQANVAERMRDLESTQEQVIERIKKLKKELDNLYLPTEQFDGILDQLAANLDRLKKTPDDQDAFRSQMETLDRLKGAVVVFNRPSSEFQPSLPRDQAVRGDILDEPGRAAAPAYDEAVKRYYELLFQP